MRYMLDTDIASYASKQSNPGVVQRLSGLALGDVCVSAITRCEMLYGVEVSPRSAKDRELVEMFLDYAEVLDFPAQAAEEYALLRGALKRRGQMIGPNDLLIAAHAMHLGVTLVTNNVREFSRVDGLNIENWAE